MPFSQGLAAQRAVACGEDWGLGPSTTGSAHLLRQNGNGKCTTAGEIQITETPSVVLRASTKILSFCVAGNAMCYSSFQRTWLLVRAQFSGPKLIIKVGLRFGAASGYA